MVPKSKITAISPKSASVSLFSDKVQNMQNVEHREYPQGELMTYSLPVSLHVVALLLSMAFMKL